MGKTKTKQIIYRSKEERQREIKSILTGLADFDLNIKYEPIKRLYKLFKIYIDDGTRIIVNIPFPEINRRIKGLLASSASEEVWINLINEQF